MSSTNHTQHYGLSQWEPEDAFLREEFNEDFRKIDGVMAGKAEIVLGTYTGDGESERVIDLGFTPKAVILENSQGYRPVNVYSGGIVLPGHPINGNMVKIVEGGFSVRSGSSAQFNSKGQVMYYIAFR